MDKILYWLVIAVIVAWVLCVTIALWDIFVVPVLVFIAIAMFVAGVTGAR